METHFSIKSGKEELQRSGGTVVRALASLHRHLDWNHAPSVICGLSLLLVVVLALRVFLRVL